VTVNVDDVKLSSTIAVGKYKKLEVADDREALERRIDWVYRTVRIRTRTESVTLRA
jgi:hypothetical protein